MVAPRCAIGSLSSLCCRRNTACVWYRNVALPRPSRAESTPCIITRLTARLASFQAQKRHGAPPRRLCGVPAQNAEKESFWAGGGGARLVVPGQIANLRCYKSLMGRGLMYFEYLLFNPRRSYLGYWQPIMYMLTVSFGFVNTEI
jgi:hypothetical protein